MTDCTAIRQQDEMYCATCRLRWDVADPAMCGKDCPSIVPGDATVQVATRGANETLPASTSRPGKDQFVSALAPDIFSRRPKI